MSIVTTGSNTTAPTRFLRAENETYGYRRFGSGPGRPLLCLQHFTGTLDNWDPAVTDPLASEREVILFDNAGVGRSTGTVANTISGMAGHAFDFLDGLGLERGRHGPRGEEQREEQGREEEHQGEGARAGQGGRATLAGVRLGADEGRGFGGQVQTHCRASRAAARGSVKA